MLRLVAEDAALALVIIAVVAHEFLVGRLDSAEGAQHRPHFRRVVWGRSAGQGPDAGRVPANPALAVHRLGALRFGVLGEVRLVRDEHVPARRRRQRLKVLHGAVVAGAQHALEARWWWLAPPAAGRRA